MSGGDADLQPAREVDCDRLDGGPADTVGAYAGIEFAVAALDAEVVFLFGKRQIAGVTDALELAVLAQLPARVVHIVVAGNKLGALEADVVLLIAPHE